MDPQQKRLSAEFATIPGAFYAGARRGVAVDRSSDSSLFVVTADRAAQALAAFHGEPQRAYHGKGKIWEDDAVYSRFFSDRTTAIHVLFVVSLYRAISSYQRRLREKGELTGSETDILRFFSQRGAIFLFMSAVASCQEIIIGRPIADMFSLSFGSEVGPAVAEEHWRPVVESLAAFHAVLQPAAESGRIRTEEIRVSALNSFRASVQALQGPLADAVFKPFAMHVVVAGTLGERT
jgi:hypothetical protein